jgi:hypothetical protein
MPKPFAAGFRHDVARSPARRIRAAPRFPLVHHFADGDHVPQVGFAGCFAEGHDTRTRRTWSPLSATAPRRVRRRRCRPARR